MKSLILQLPAKSFAYTRRTWPPRARAKLVGIARGIFWLVLAWLAGLPLAHAQNVVLTVTNRVAQIGWFSYPGQAYQLQWAAELNTNSSWFDLGSLVVGTGTTNYVTDPMADNRRFYRVKRPVHQTWEKVANMPTARDSLGAAAGPDGRIYAIGGEDASGSGGLNTVEAYTPGTPGSWARMANMPTPRYFHAVVTGKDGLIYAMGGLAPVGGVLATLEVYTPSTDSWATKASMPTPRAWFSAAAGPDGRIYAIGGGNDSDNVLATVDVYTPSTDSWAPATSMPTARNNFASATTADHLTTYVIGGYAGGSGLSTVEAFTPNAGPGTWTTKAGLPTARLWFSAAAGADGRIYAIGGNNVIFNVATTEAYTPSTDSWVTVPYMPTARSFLAAATGADGRIYAIGGQDGPLPVGATVEVYVP